MRHLRPMVAASPIRDEDPVELDGSIRWAATMLEPRGRDAHTLHADTATPLVVQVRAPIMLDAVAQVEADRSGGGAEDATLTWTDGPGQIRRASVMLGTLHGLSLTPGTWRLFVVTVGSPRMLAGIVTVG